MKKVKEEIKKVLPKKTETKLFLFAFLFLVFITVLLVYNYAIDKNYNLLFDSDTARVIGDATIINTEHYRLSVHPLFVLFTQPIVFLIQGIVLNKNIAISILSALVSGLSTLYIYKILNKINKDNKKNNIIISLIYLFSFSNMIFTAGIETYNFAALFLIMMWYYFISKKEEYNKYSYIILVAFGISSFAFTITNCIAFLILLFILLISKKVKLKNIIIIGLVTLASVVSLNVFQKVIWNNTPLIWKTNAVEEGNGFSEKKLSLTSFKNLISGDYFNSMISSNVYVKTSYGIKYNGQNYIINFEKTSIPNLIVLTLFYMLTIVYLIRNFKKNKYINIGLLLSLAFNSVLHLFYGNNGTFLYSLHFIYLIVLLFGINFISDDNKIYKKYTYYYLVLFLIYEIINNNYIYIKCMKLIKEVINSNYLLANLGFIKTFILELLIIIGIVILVFGCLFIFRKIKDTKKTEEKTVYGILLVLLIIGVQSIFIALESAPFNNRLFMVSLKGQTGEIEPKAKEDYLGQDFKKYFKNEIKELNDYKDEYDTFIKEYNPELFGNINWSDYYYFGLGNRKKYLYKPNKIIDIETKKEIITFKEKEHMIVPNLYTVIIETIDGDFIKIEENEDGIFYIVNDKKKILDGTKKHINLYDFSDQKYRNIKKVLYGEILFNIKDSVIYPNVIVYDKPWYRDAAIASMVLKYTNNTDLIKNWVSNISDIYDLQNAGIKEADNLGELLYILSTQEDINYELVNKIQEEANQIASSNEDGYYIKGQTDFGNMYLYQNLWYKLGMESIGREYPFDLSIIPEDRYALMAWWSDYQTIDTNAIESVEYPYLTYASRHKLNSGKIVMNINLYPLSWEINASQAKYNNYEGIDNLMKNDKTSPIHTWAASELLLWLLNETNDLNR